LTVKWAEEAGVPLAKALKRITAAPAGVLKLDAGHIAVGAAADLCLFDRHAYWHVEPRALKSQGHNTPFLGYELPARVRTTIVAGNVAFEQR
jgi:dihydroorotase